MNVRKFVGANAREALRKVKETLGPDAVILSNRNVGGTVEIIAVAARDMAMIVPPVEEETARPLARPLAQQPVAGEDDDYRVSLSRARGANLAADPIRSPLWEKVGASNFDALLSRKIAARARPAQKPEARPAATVNAAIPKTDALRRAMATTASPRERRAEPADQAGAEIVPAAVVEEIRTLRKLVEQHLAGFAWSETARAEPVKAELLRQMLDVGFSPQFARELLMDLPSGMDLGQARAWARGAADRAFLTASADCDLIDRGGVYALLGPTGVGKTTTAAKLAARCVLRHGASKVALVTTDSYRIGAHEQLRIYGRILGITVYLARDAAELRQILGELRQKHMVLIDTMGMSQKDKLVLELNAMLVECGVARLLTLAATSRGDTLDDVVRAWRGDGLSGCILTKIDESASLAPSLDAIMRHDLTLAYVSNGQRVPEDLHLPNRSYLLHRAFKTAPEAAHRLGVAESGLLMANAGLAEARHG
ncbi:MAG: flagellar biosynthesis protein FlhF [Zoogloeaceae bacterium]|jgi:flagellar biosynthesis protein FlhF|nr:flagellar biosynthesis protein FlhF [Zoogloeaceae bacterium]